MPKTIPCTHNVTRATLAAALAACLLGAAHQAIAADLAQLDKLTPSGAEKEGNKEGTIPAWQGAEAPLPGWEWGKLRQSYWKHKDEKPLLTIDASNADKYADKLTAGQLAMLKQRKDYRMEVFQIGRAHV